MIELKVPSIGESVTEVTVASFLVEDGSFVERDQNLCELESDKATFELPAEQAGIVHFVVAEGDDLAIGDVVCTIDTSASESNSNSTTTTTETSQAKEEDSTSSSKDTTSSSEDTASSSEDTTKSTATTYATGHPSPAAAKLLAENGIATTDVNGSGVAGRITKADAQQAVQTKKQQSSTSKPATSKPESNKPESQQSNPSTGREVRRKKMSRLRKTISRRLVSVKNDTAMLTTFNEVDLTEVIAIRKKYKEEFKEKQGIGLGFMSFFTKAVAIALQDFPTVNAYIDDDYMEYHDYVDISIAVSTPKGLVVPVIRDAHQLDMAGIEKAVKTLAIKGRDGKLTMDDMTGGTFTITNGGVFGSLLSTPIINPPQSAILGMHSIQQRPVVINGEVVARPMMYVALSYDHRIIDGKEAVSFLVRVKGLLEEPMKLFLGL